MSHKYPAFLRTLLIIFFITLVPGLVWAQETGPQQLLVNFISVGSGIDSRAMNQFDEFITRFSKENTVKLHYNTRHWGKEGEIEYVFNLKNLKSKQRKALKDSVQIMYKDNRRVQISDRE